MTTGGYRLVVAATAERSLARLPEAVAAAIVELMAGPLVEAPRRLGHPLQQGARRALVGTSRCLPGRS